MTVSTLRFYVFGGYLDREPEGGMKDLKKRFAIRGEAIAFAQGYVVGQGVSSWAHVYDMHEGKMVQEFKGSDH